MRLAGVLITGLIVLVLVIAGVSWMVVRLTTPALQAPAAAQPIYVPCGDGTYALSQEHCERARAPIASDGASEVTELRTDPPADPLQDPPRLPAPTEIPPPAPVVEPTAPPSAAGKIYPECPDDMQTVEQVAARLGGNAANWITPDWVTSTTQGAWVFRSRESIRLAYPGSGFFDTPQGRYFQEAVTASEASYHCEPPPP